MHDRGRARAGVRRPGVGRPRRRSSASRRKASDRVGRMARRARRCGPPSVGRRRCPLRRPGGAAIFAGAAAVATRAPPMAPARHVTTAGRREPLTRRSSTHTRGPRRRRVVEDCSARGAALAPQRVERSSSRGSSADRGFTTAAARITACTGCSNGTNCWPSSKRRAPGAAGSSRRRRGRRRQDGARAGVRGACRRPRAVRSLREPDDADAARALPRRLRACGCRAASRERRRRAPSSTSSSEPTARRPRGPPLGRPGDSRRPPVLGRRSTRLVRSCSRRTATTRPRASTRCASFSASSPPRRACRECPSRGSRSRRCARWRSRTAPTARRSTG